ncbi:MAG: AAA family ATPase [Bacteroidetes bacterium]|nr:AAA family ATPase [Bacteroidota bacterium]
MERLREKFYQKINDTELRIVREFIDKVDWSNRMIGITGGRGCGKTTLILQYIKKRLPLNESVLYVSLDDIYFAAHNLVDLVADFIRNGGKYLFLDEVHKYQSWANEIKNLYDDYANLKVVFTGSSMIDLHKAKADLSRRAVMYEMHGLSLREFILFDQGLMLPSYSLEDILKNHVPICLEINKVTKPIKLFNDYLRYGYFPYFLENRMAYLQKLAGTIDVVLESDIPGIINLPMASVEKMRLLLSIISEGVPFQPNINKLSEKTGIARNTIIQYFHLLEDARIIMLLHASTKGISRMQKPEKIYLYHPNHMYALTTANTEKGNLRETFFLNQVSQNHTVTFPSSGDFLADDQWLFEIGGKSKGGSQLQDHPNGYVVADDIEYDSGNRIPLWLFGFLA